MSQMINKFIETEKSELCIIIDIILIAQTSTAIHVNVTAYLCALDDGTTLIVQPFEIKRIVEKEEIEKTQAKSRLRYEIGLARGKEFTKIADSKSEDELLNEEVYKSKKFILGIKPDCILVIKEILEGDDTELSQTKWFFPLGAFQTSDEANWQLSESYKDFINGTV